MCSHCWRGSTTVLYDTNEVTDATIVNTLQWIDREGVGPSTKVSSNRVWIKHRRGEESPKNHF